MLANISYQTCIPTYSQFSRVGCNTFKSVLHTTLVSSCHSLPDIIHFQCVPSFVFHCMTIKLPTVFWLYSIGFTFKDDFFLPKVHIFTFRMDGNNQ